MWLSLRTKKRSEKIATTRRRLSCRPRMPEQVLQQKAAPEKKTTLKRSKIDLTSRVMKVKDVNEIQERSDE